jgi:hypothetical protein
VKPELLIANFSKDVIINIVIGGEGCTSKHVTGLAEEKEYVQVVTQNLFRF